MSGTRELYYEHYNSGGNFTSGAAKKVVPAMSSVTVNVKRAGEV